MKGYVIALAAIAALLFAVPCEAGGVGRFGACGVGGCNVGVSQSLSVNHNFGRFGAGLGGFNRFGALGGLNLRQPRVTRRVQIGGRGVLNRGGVRHTLRIR